MSGVSDGATVRRERMLDLLQYIRGFMPKGLPLSQVQLYMSMAHGLTYKTSMRYVMDFQLGKVLVIEAGYVKMRLDNFKKYLQHLAPERDPDTGAMIDFVYGDIELITKMGEKKDGYPEPDPVIEEINSRLEKKKREKKGQVQAVISCFNEENGYEARLRDIHNVMMDLDYVEPEARYHTLRHLEALIKKGLIKKVKRGHYALVKES